MASQATMRKNKKEPEKPMLSQVGQRCREGIFILCMALAIFLLIALITYQAGDPGWSHTAITQHISNAGGRVGAWLADLFLYIFGYIAYVLPFMLFYALAMMLQQDSAEPAIDQPMLALRSIGFTLMVTTLSGLCSLHIHHLFAPLPFSAGGILGNLMGPGLAEAFNPLGCTLLLTALFLMGILFFTGLSWVSLMEKSSQQAWQGLQVLQNKVMEGLSTAVKRIKQWLTSKSTSTLPSKPHFSNQKRTVAKKQLSLTSKTESLPVNRALPAPTSMPIINKPSTVNTRKPVQSSLPIETPDIALLNKPKINSEHEVSDSVLQEASFEVEQRLLDFGVEARVVAVHPGPVITRYELALAPGVKASKIVGLAKDLARSLSTISVRVVEVIPGKSVIGLELPNQHRETVTLRDILESATYVEAASPITMALGKDIAGGPVVADLAKMPHLLVAGTTGSGKSVGLNAMLLSILYKSTPEQVRFILIDPKMLELSIYDDIPHLLTPVVTDMKEATSALRWCVGEMERRYKLMASLGVRNLAGFNKKVNQARKEGNPLRDPLLSPPGAEEVVYLEAMPRIVVIIDELADMMMVVGKKVEDLIARIAQKARAAGIHLILATQRPSVDVITGLIKANIPTRIAFQVSSRIDSRTIIDQQGAEQLLGQGDMLYLPPGTGIPTRVHGAFVSDDEVHNVVKALKKQSRPDYSVDIFENVVDDQSGSGSEDSEADPLYDRALELVTRTRKASISSVQRYLKVGYNRAARIIEAMEMAGVVTPMEGNGSREVLAPPPIED
ncbi:MAG: DNA translocase FtsK [Gammaproteobacteria bacterium]